MSSLTSDFHLAYVAKFQSELNGIFLKISESYVHARFLNFQLFCQGVMPSPETNFFSTCMPYIGNMLTCLEEGTAVYPPPVKNFHAIFVGDDQV